MNQETKRALAWLRRPELRLDLVSQLRLYGLAQQATHGNATAATEVLRNTAGRACSACRVQTLKSQSWHACHGLHQAAAAKQLVQELAARDPCFGGAGDFDLWHLVRGLLKAKLPKASAASSKMPLPLLAAMLAAVWMASRGRHQRFKRCRLMAGILAMLASAAGGRPSSSGVTVRGRSEFQNLVSVLSFKAAFRNMAREASDQDMVSFGPMLQSVSGPVYRKHC
ncbi:unnamed protein product [Symbiodinium sp. CCMP2592]|nr:unnamed protein product [Symbiodinium sp. CCMP2592]